MFDYDDIPDESDRAREDARWDDPEPESEECRGEASPWGPCGGCARCSGFEADGDQVQGNDEVDDE